MKLLKNCSENAPKLLWNCSENALKLLWNCSETALKLPWNHSDLRVKPSSDYGPWSLPKLSEAIHCCSRCWNRCWLHHDTMIYCLEHVLMGSFLQVEIDHSQLPEQNDMYCAAPYSAGLQGNHCNSNLILTNLLAIFIALFSKIIHPDRNGRLCSYWSNETEVFRHECRRS